MRIRQIGGLLRFTLLFHVRRGLESVQRSPSKLRLSRFYFGNFEAIRSVYNGLTHFAKCC